MVRFLALVPLVATLAGCITTSARHIDDDERAKLRTENKSVVLLHTSLHDAGCTLVQARLAQPDSSGRYVQGELVNLRGILDAKVPSQLMLPAGDYGIVGLTCQVGNKRTHFGTRVAQRGSILDGSGTVYERPIATFKVGVGEVIDIGSLRLPTRQGQGGGQFIAVVTPIPEMWLNNLAIANPKLTQDRVARPMAAAIRI